MPHTSLVPLLISKTYKKSNKKPRKNNPQSIFAHTPDTRKVREALPNTSVFLQLSSFPGRMLSSKRRKKVSDSQYPLVVHALLLL